MTPEHAKTAASKSSPHFKRPDAWKLVLLAGFATQLLLIVFVSAIGLQQLVATTHKLDTVIETNMRKQSLTKTMVATSRERTVIMFMLSEIDDPFKRDELLMRFNIKGNEYVTARLDFLKMPLNNKERELIDLQRKLIAIAQPIQDQTIKLIETDRIPMAKNLVVKQVIPAQNNVIAVLAQLDEETQRIAQAAIATAHEAHHSARSWIYLFSGMALLAGFIVATVVLRHINRVSRERELATTHDTLTGLPNRTLFMDRLEQSLIRAQRNKTLVGVMFIDLDRFKRINDTLGHASGDALICEVAARLRAATRAEDIVARQGGDEFVVVISDAAGLNHILPVTDKMLAVINQPYRIEGREIFCSSSIGVSIYPNDGTDSTSLLKNADTAMYAAKKNGGDRFQLYNTAMNAMAEERLQLETELHYALERDEFVFHYQPQLNLDTGRIQGVEALIRWNNPEKGLLSPAVFLDLLEETGGIVSVGNKLMLAACHQTARWHAAGFADLTVAINVSSKEFWHEHLIPGIQAALTQSGMRPDTLHIELTEGIFMQDVERAIDRIQELKKLGISIAVDDFGTGYSSLAHLKRFPVDILKIDRYFVKDLPDDRANKALIRSILTLCHGLHLDTVAEGVEDRPQLESLRKLGCRIIQGYLVSRPVPAEQIVTLLERDWSQEFKLV